MKKTLYIIQNDSVVRGCLLIGVSTLLIGLALVGFFWRGLPDYLALYPKLPWGYPRIGTKLEILYPCVVIMGFYIGTFSFFSAVYERAMLLGRFLAMTLGIMSLFFLIFIIETIRII